MTENLEEYKAALDEIREATLVLLKHRPLMQKLIDQRRYMDNVGGLLDPTLYQRVLHDKGLASQLRLAKALIVYTAVYEELRDEAIKDLLTKAEAEIEKKEGSPQENP